MGIENPKEDLTKKSPDEIVADLRAEMGIDVSKKKENVAQVKEILQAIDTILKGSGENIMFGTDEETKLRDAIENSDRDALKHWSAVLRDRIEESKRPYNEEWTRIALPGTKELSKLLEDLLGLNT